VRTLFVAVAQLGGKVAAEAGQLGRQAPGERRSPALLEDRPLDPLDAIVMAGRPARMNAWLAPSARMVSLKTPERNSEPLSDRTRSRARHH
jgi:hypothetical protein